MVNLTDIQKQQIIEIYPKIKTGRADSVETTKKMVILCPCRTNQSDLYKNLWFKQITPVIFHPILSYNGIRLMCGTIALFVNYEDSYFRKHKWLLHKINICPLDFHDHVQRSKF